MPKPRPLTLVELTELLPRLHATMALLVGDAGGRRALDPVAVPPARRGRRNGAATLALQDKLLKALKSSRKGLSLGEVVAKVGADRNAIKYHLRQLRGQKRARVAGDRKFARWFAQK